MRLWAMENGLRDQGGHHFNNSIGLRQACAERGLACRFLVHHAADAAVVAALGARTVFRFSPYDRASTEPLAGPLESLMIQGHAFAEGLVAAAGEGLAADDLVYVPTTTQHELLGCAIGLAKIAPALRPRLVLNFMMENFLAPRALTPGRNAAFYRFAMRNLTRVCAPKQLLLTANGANMARHLSEVLAQRVEWYPVPKFYPVQLWRASDRPESSGPPIVAVLGDYRAEKGFDIVPAVIARHPELRFLIHLSRPPQQELWRHSAGRSQSANVEVAEGILDTEAFHALVARADIVLLPYDPARLPFRTSGVFSEALAAAKPVVVPRGTWMEEQLAAGHGAGVLFATRDVADISGALRDAVAALPKLRAEQSISAYLDRALRAFGIARPAQSA